MLDWPPKSHTCILMFLYSTDSTLNPIAGSVRARTGNRRNHLSQLQAVQDSSLSCAVQPQHQNTHRRTPPPEPERIVQRRERHAHPCAVRGAYRRREGISRDVLSACVTLQLRLPPRASAQDDYVRSLSSAKTRMAGAARMRCADSGLPLPSCPVAASRGGPGIRDVCFSRGRLPPTDSTRR